MREDVHFCVCLCVLSPVFMYCRLEKLEMVGKIPKDEDALKVTSLYKEIGF